jgi:AcrR family transcriptional regulator
MEAEIPSKPSPPKRLGRPRRGTESSRNDSLFEAATRVFLRDGYGAASIDKVATEAGVSTRTIYERFKNKADLLGAVISRLCERDMARAFATDGMDRLEPREALMAIGRVMTGRARDLDSMALFRIIVTESQRFPELATKMRSDVKGKVHCAIADYFRGQTERGVLVLREPDRAAPLFAHMVYSQLHECMLFGSTEETVNLDCDAHLAHVVDIFLNGALPRNDAAR